MSRPLLRHCHGNSVGDFQWHTGPRYESDDFYSGSSGSLEVSRRDVSCVAGTSGCVSIVAGAGICKNGRNGYKDCQEIRNSSICHSSNCNQIQMGERLATGGDSGGSVFWGRTAYGLHQGWHYDPTWPADRDLASKADRIDNALGIYVATS